MKNLMKPAVAVMLSAAVLAGCGKASKPAPEAETKETQQAEKENMEDIDSGMEMQVDPGTAVEYSNISDEDSKKLVAQLLKDAGVSDERAGVFFDHVDQFNKSVDSSVLTSGFEKSGSRETKYDPYEVQDQWLAKNPDFEGYNCRITSYGLFGDFLKAGNNAALATQDLVFDFNSIAQDASAVPDAAAKNVFTSVFAAVPTDATKDVAVHADKLAKEWSARGVSFQDSDKIRMISVVFHNQIFEGEDYLFAGHAGILLPQEDGTLYFVEKLAFMEPYRVNKFADRAGLNTYLMEKYDLDFEQPTEKPFVMENDKLMEF